MFGFGKSTLQPVSPPLALFPGFVRDQPTTLVIKERVWSLSGDDFSVKDLEGNVIVKVKGKNMSFRDRKVFEDPHGKTLFSIRDKMIAIHRSFVGEDEHGKDLFRVHKKMMSMHDTLVCELTAKDENRELEVKGDLVWYDAEIVLKNGHRVAKIDRKLANVRQAFDDKQTYFVTVAAGMDLALAAGLAICVDELHEDK